MWTAEKQETFMQMICDDLPPQYHLPLISTLAKFLALREAPRRWYQKAAKAVALTFTSGTVREVWKIYNRFSAGPPSILTGFSYGDRLIRFVFGSLSFAVWIVFFGGAEFAANLITRLGETREDNLRQP